MTVIKIEPAVTHRCCPKCGYIMSQLEIDLIRVVINCPRGCDHNINDFQPMRRVL